MVELETELDFAMEEIVHNQEAIEHMSRQLNQLLVERDSVVNTGKHFEDIGKQQKKKWKLARVQNAADTALWFAESFVLVAMQLTVHTAKSDEAITIPL